LTVVLYGCETCSLILREKCSLRVPENMILRQIIGPQERMGSGEGIVMRNFIVHNIVMMIKSRR
jgi:hypothetical protein